MRTTVELPPELMRQAKARAATRGESLKALLLRAVAAELGRSPSPMEERTPVNLPLFGNPKGKPVDISGKDIARALALGAHQMSNLKRSDGKKEFYRLMLISKDASRVRQAGCPS